MKMGDKRPLCKWKPYQNRLPLDAEIESWFGEGSDLGIAVIFGDVSSGLASRDFDDMDAYRRWANLNPQLAKRLPTVATQRGRHVYFTAKRSEVSKARQLAGNPNGVGAIKTEDGELRIGHGCYSVLPPSQHPTGAVYEWRIPLLEGPPPVVDIVESGLLEGERATEKTEITEQSEITEQTEAMASVHSVYSVARGDVTPFSEEIEQATLDTLPNGPGQRNRQIFEFARSLKAIPGLHDAPAKSLKPYVEEWHRRAKPVITTQPFEETWIDFIKGWKSVKFPKGQNPLDGILAVARESEVPEVALQYEQPNVRLVVSICRELQRRVGTEPFFLSCRKLGSMVNVDHTTASRWLYLLVQDGILRLVKTGNSYKAHRYRYLADLKPL
jgi:hypothetical protein